MKINLPSGDFAWLIGDPHLGRKFERGVPAHRRGEREKAQFERFVAELGTPGVAYNIMVGDLYDHPHVSPSVVVAAAQAYLLAADQWPRTTFIALAGNHDLSRDINVVGAWQLFCKIVDGRLPNLITVTEPWDDDELLIMPWQWGVPAADQVKLYEGSNILARTAIGHWDLQSFGGDDSHMAPTQELHDLGVTEIYGGHYHTPGDYQVAGHVVHCTGSLEPFSHAEDPDGEIYVTLTLAEATDGRDLSDKFVRLELEQGEIVPEDLNVQALTTRLTKAEATELLPQENFEWGKIMAEALDGLTPEVKGFITERITPA